MVGVQTVINDLMSKNYWWKTIKFKMLFRNPTISRSLVVAGNSYHKAEAPLSLRCFILGSSEEMGDSGLDGHGGG